jgi:hypothetical protein
MEYNFSRSQYHNFHQVVLINMYNFMLTNIMRLTVYQINLIPPIQMTKYQQMNKSLLLTLPFFHKL